MTTASHELPGEQRPALTARYPWLLGLIGLALVAVAFVLQAVGIVLAGGGDWAQGTLMAWLAICLSTVAFAVGLAAVIRRRMWPLGALVMVLALLANPYLLARLLDALG